MRAHLIFIYGKGFQLIFKLNILFRIISTPLRVRTTKFPYRHGDFIFPHFSLSAVVYGANIRFLALRKIKWVDAHYRSLQKWKILDQHKCSICHLFNKHCSAVKPKANTSFLPQYQGCGRICRLLGQDVIPWFCSFEQVRMHLVFLCICFSMRTVFVKWSLCGISLYKKIKQSEPIEIGREVQKLNPPTCLGHCWGTWEGSQGSSSHWWMTPWGYICDVNTTSHSLSWY